MSNERTRTSFPEAVKITLDTLINGDIFSVSQLSRESGLNQRTIEKSLNCLLTIQDYFEKNKLIVNKTPGMIAVQLTEKSGLFSLPEKLQKFVIRTLYFPTPSREEEILVYLYIKEAFNPEDIEHLDKMDMVEKLEKQGQIIRAREGKYYLSDEGIIVAKGIIKLYPELLELKR